MKKTLRYADCFVLLAAIIGCLLRLWFDSVGTDNRGLYLPRHPVWIGLCVFSAAVVAGIWFLTRSAGDNTDYKENFRPSLLSTASYLLLAIVLGYVGITELLDATKWLNRICAVITMAAAVTLAVAGLERYGGHRPAFFLHLVPSTTMALRMFLLSKDWAIEPEICSFLFAFFASVALVPAFYHLWAFDVDMADRRKSLFWSLTAAYFSLVASFENLNDWVMHLAFASFLLTNLCRLKYLPAPAAEEEASAAEPAQPVGETPVVEAAPSAAAEPPVRVKAVLHADIDPETDMAAFLEDIKRFLEDDET